VASMPGFVRVMPPVCRNGPAPAGQGLGKVVVTVRVPVVRPRS
jgi:hypothetical protein